MRLYGYTQPYCLIEIVWRTANTLSDNGRIVMFKVFPRTSSMFMDVHLCTTYRQAGLPYGSIWTEKNILNEGWPNSSRIAMQGQAARLSEQM